jgi:hypothetical protein
MADQYTITVSDEDAKYRDFALEIANSSLGEDAPANINELIQLSFDSMIMQAWKRAYQDAKVVNIQGVLEQSDDETKAATVGAIEALQTMTPDEQKAALQAIANMKKTVEG